MSLAKKMVIGGIVIMLLPLAAVSIFSTIKAYDELVAEGKQKLLYTAKLMAEVAEDILEEEIRIAGGLAETDSVIEAARLAAGKGPGAMGPNLKKLSAELARIHKKIGQHYEAILFAAMTGEIVADSLNGAYKGINIKDRGYFKKAQAGQANVGDAVKSRGSGKAVVPIASPITLGNEVMGVLALVMKTDYLSKTISGFMVGKTGYGWMVNRAGVLVAHPKQENILKLNLATLDGMKEFMTTMFKGNVGVESYTFQGVDKLCGHAPVPVAGWFVGVTEDVDDILYAARGTRNTIIIISLASLALGAAVTWFVSRGIVRPVIEMVDCFKMLSSGDLNARMNARSKDELGTMALAFNEFTKDLNNSISQVRLSSEQVDSASQELSSGNQELSDRVQNQAAAIEETAATIEQMSSSVKANSDNAESAKTLASSTAEMATEGGKVVREAVEAMGRVQDSSRKINDIIDVVNEIAFQTNLLALNASVEAARAGDVGRGFAVVAGEVRNLAQRSANAAKQIQDLIKDSVDKVEHGSELITRSGETLDLIIGQVQRVADTITEISASAREQSEAIDQIDTAVVQLDKVTQQNASMVEETASASEELSAEAASLQQMVARFKLINEDRKTALAPKALSAPEPATGKVALYRHAGGVRAKGNGGRHRADGFFHSDDMAEFKEF